MTSCGFPKVKQIGILFLIIFKKLKWILNSLLIMASGYYF